MCIFDVKQFNFFLENISIEKKKSIYESNQGKILFIDVDHCLMSTLNKKQLREINFGMVCQGMVVLVMFQAAQ